MLSYYVTFVVTVYGEFFGKPNSSPHEMSRGPVCKASLNPCAFDLGFMRLEALLGLLNHDHSRLYVNTIILCKPCIFPLASRLTSLLC